MTDNAPAEKMEVTNDENSWAETVGPPIVLEVKRKKSKSKKKYRATKGLRELQRLDRQLSRIVLTTNKAMLAGTQTYVKERDRSAKERRDGAIRDFIPNLGEALSEGLVEMTDLPRDLAKMANTKRMRKDIRRQIRLMSGPMRMITR